MFDNLPFHPVVDFIQKRHPPGGKPLAVPHLIFTASLEPRPQKWDRERASSWLSVRSRAKQMKFNKKIDNFVRAQREVRRIFQERSRTETIGREACSGVRAWSSAFNSAWCTEEKSA
jgi:hypothetical protein